MSWNPTISVGGAIYSVPSRLVDERVWARAEGSELVVVHADSADGPREVAIGRLIRADLIVIDDIGMLAVAAETAEALFRVVDAAYEKGSIALTQHPPRGFDELMPQDARRRHRRSPPAPRARVAD